ncbi:alpha/beta hydrolase [Pseudoxanthomonas winnipegensis]|uniref:Alpha/beta hydrolase n=1 Tax=Pseudoxanthomonas winnipegensis TaxID=2480810 RepID=A0A4V2HFS5_9GAMM|nr:alpha/beta hydrolase-fold protein [Pseudoxanthomonas winnipegensis]TAA39621.1 alpha/beta hydrolase [Pseudoxanthomonas winnipegensis]
MKTIPMLLAALIALGAVALPTAPAHAGAPAASAGAGAGVQVPPVPTGPQYMAMTAQQRYDLRLRIRALPEAQRAPWLARLKVAVDALPEDQRLLLHDERNQMDAEHGTKPVEASQPRIVQFNLQGPNERIYTISIARPDASAPAGGYPVIYVLDANAMFTTVADSARLQAFRPSWTGVAPAVVVGIGVPGDGLFDLPGRYLDLTTPVPGGGASPAGGPPMKTGGADAFLAFIQNQVKPAVQARISIDRARQALFGHSLGGLFVLHTLFTHPDAFQAYIAVSPSVWWGNGSLFKEAEAFVAAGQGQGARVLLTVGQYEQALSAAALAASGADEQRAALDRIKEVDQVARMAQLLARDPALVLRHRVLAGEDHGSGAAPAASLAVRFALLPPAQFPGQDP